MRSAASRLHKGFSYERRFAACEGYTVADASAWAGLWAYWAPGGRRRAQPFAHVVLDLGCGKGEYTVACAKLRPDVLFVGFDVDAVCTLRSAEEAKAAGVDNAVFLLVNDPFSPGVEGVGEQAGAVSEVDEARGVEGRDAHLADAKRDVGCAEGSGRVNSVEAMPPAARENETVGRTPFVDAHASQAAGSPSGERHRSGAPAELDLASAFAPGELSCILMNFPTPFPKKKKASLRLTYLDRLMGYRSLLREGAGIRLRTDSQPLRDFTLTQLTLAGYDVAWRSEDVRAACPDEPWSAYERKLAEQGARALGLFAKPGPAPEHVEQTAPLSLVSYLPDDIDDLAYIPHGMQGYIENQRNRRANERARGAVEYRPPRV